MKPETSRSSPRTPTPAPLDSGASGSQTTFNNGRAVSRPREDVREQLLDLAEEELEAAPRATSSWSTATVRVKGSPTKSVSIPTLAEKAQGDRLLLGRGADAAAGDARRRRLRLHRPAGNGVVPRADVHHPRGARQGRP